MNFQLRWYTDSELSGHKLSLLERSWLCDAGSLTRKLQQYNASVSLQLSSVPSSPVLPPERSWLQASSATVLQVREIQWCLNQVPLILARVLLPKQSPSPLFASFPTYGVRSIGSVLFQPGVISSPLSFAMLTADHAYAKMVYATTLAFPVGGVWLRRRQFMHKTAKIMVIELFMPNFLQSLRG